VIRIGRIAFAASLLFGSALAQIAVTPFSADMNTQMKGGKTVAGKIYISGTKMRMDMNTNGHNTELITDGNAQTAYMVVPEQHMYMEMHMDKLQGHERFSSLKNYDPNNPCANQEDMTCEKQGSEDVNGRSTDKWLFKNKGSGATTMTLWIDKKLHFPVKNVLSDGTETNLTNIQETAPPASTFDVPTSYRKFDMGGRN
jgi:outer membrane lipoprotein-sorting protein